MAPNSSVAGGVCALTLLGRQVLETKSLIEHAVEDVCLSFENTARRSQQNLERTTNFLGQHRESKPQDRETDLERLIENSEQVLHKLLDRLTEACDKSRSAIQRLNQIEERISRVSYTLSQMNDIAAANRILAVNARIQAAQLGQQGMGFGVVADEISAQAKRSGEFSESISTLIQQLQEAVALSRQDLVATAGHDREAMDESKREVVRTHADFRHMLDRTHRFLTESAAESRRLTSDIHDSVRGLQFQDRVSQRLEFVSNEIAAIGASLATEFDIDLGAAHAHPVVRDMLTRTSMSDQRGSTSITLASTGGDVELF